MTRAVLEERLAAFALSEGFSGKGALSIALVVTQHAKRLGLPINAETLLTKKGAQVLGAGGEAVQAVLKKHGITRQLAAEGGRTSRGSVEKMRQYVSFLNGLSDELPVDLEAVEAFWIRGVHGFFAGKPFKIRLDLSQALRTVVRDVIAQAVDRQKTTPGMYYAGAVLQHLVGAKLDCALGRGNVQHNSFSTADSPTSRLGDFWIGDVVIHVTTSPSEAVIAKCGENLNEGYRPVLVTLQRGLAVAEGLAINAGFSDRLDIFEIEQFVALNLYELGHFLAEGRRTAITDLVNRYNEIVDDIETDPSLRIEFR